MRRILIILALLVMLPGLARAQAPDPTVAYEVSGYGVDGTAFGVTWTASGALFDGINDYISLPCAGIDSAGFDGDIGFIVFEALPDDWSPANYYWLFRIEADANNYLQANIYYYNSYLYLNRTGSGGSALTTNADPGGWFSIVMSYDQSGPTHDYYLNGSGLSESGTPGAWSGALANCLLGQRAAAYFYPGYIRNFIIGLGVYLDSDDVAALTAALENETLSANKLDDIAGAGNWLWWPLRPVTESDDTFNYLILPSNQMAAVEYRITAGDYALALLLFLACLLLAVLVTVQVLNMRRAK